jgi:hypothetical protein
MGAQGAYQPKNGGFRPGQFDATSGNATTSFPTLGRFGVRKVEAFVYEPDGRTYAYADVVNYTCAAWIGLGGSVALSLCTTAHPLHSSCRTRQDIR